MVHAIREVGMLESVCDMLLYCSFCNEAFSTNLLKQLMVSPLSVFNFLLVITVQIDKIIWASVRENLSSGVCEQQRRRPACA